MTRLEELVKELDSCFSDIGTYIVGYGKKKYRYGKSYKGRSIKEVTDELKEKISELPVRD